MTKNEPKFLKKKEQKFWKKEIFNKNLKITILKLKLKIVKLWN